MIIQPKGIKQRGPAGTQAKTEETRRRSALVLGSAIILLALVVVLLVSRDPTTEAAIPANDPVEPSASLEPAAAAPLTAEDMELFLDDALGRQMAAQHIKAAAAAVVKDGELLVARGYGTIDLEGKQPVVADETIFLTGSTGKIFVWTAVMQLVEQGKLDVDTDVNEYLDFRIPATYPEPITLRHLMSHSAGFEDQFYVYAHDTSDLEPAGDYLAHTIPTRVRPPGEVSAYSNYGAALAGYLVERVTGMPFERYVEEYLFAPLAMHSSSFRQPPPPELAAQRVPSYAYEEGDFHQLPAKYIRTPATGASVTTVTDMANFMIAHLEQGRFGTTHILREEAVAQMHTRHFSHDPRVNGFAHGFAESTLNGQRLLRHEGEVPGRGCSAMMLLPAERLGFYVTYNGMCTMNTGTPIWQSLLDRYFPAPAPASAVTVATPSEELQVLAGSYRSSRRPYTSFGKSIVLAGGAFGDIKVTVTGDGALRTEGLGPEPLAWVEVEPYLFTPASNPRTIYGHLVFQPASEDHGPRLLVENVPYRAWEQVAWYQTVEFGLVLLGIVAVVMLSALLLPLAGLMLRGRSLTVILPATDLRRARRLAAVAAALYLLFPLFLLLTVFEAIEYGVSAAFVLTLSLPLLAGALVIASVYFAVRGWKDPAWGGVLGRMHYASLVVAAAAFSMWLGSWNLFGFRF